MRLIILIISIAIIGWLFYKYINQNINQGVPADTGLNINEDATILDVPDYARDALSSAQLKECLHICDINLDALGNCQENCQQKYPQ